MNNLIDELEKSQNNISILSIQKIYEILQKACQELLKHYHKFTTKYSFVFTFKTQQSMPRKLKKQPGETLKRIYQNKILHEYRSIDGSPLNQQTTQIANQDRNEIAQQLSQQLEDGMRFQEVDNPKSNFLSRLSHDIQNSDDFDIQNPALQQPTVIQDQVVVQNFYQQLDVMNNQNIQQNPTAIQDNTQITKRKRIVQKQKTPVFNLVLDEMEENNTKHKQKQHLQHQVGFQIPNQLFQMIKDREIITLSSSVVRTGESLGSLHTVEAMMYQHDEQPAHIDLNDVQEIPMFENFVNNYNIEENQTQNIYWFDDNNEGQKRLFYKKELRDVQNFMQALNLYHTDQYTLIQESQYSVLIRQNQQ